MEVAYVSNVADNDRHHRPFGGNFRQSSRTTILKKCYTATSGSMQKTRSRYTVTLLIN